MFDYNCDVAQSYGIYQNKEELEIAQYASSINISAGFHSGDPVSIRSAMIFAKDHNIALGAHIGYPDIQGFGRRAMDLSDEELEAVVVYQIGAILAYAKAQGLEIEQVRAHGALKDKINTDENTAIVVARALKKVSPWLNLIVQNYETKKIVENEGAKAALEVDYLEEADFFKKLEEIETEKRPDTIHFRKLEDIKKAYEALKPSPINYNRVQHQI